ncbi:hypothetical protein [Clostridium taeniosporum]|uniref:Uncharacterized protein n=1 Tax=Clostridium taeniosporum TaxID=394958 RepID=A0A1D7XP61_9CLOT|nr:hypothetical protein [Clostridium taeniosporum]AOR25121.1 hypothetical protein BGI42_15370 [Clostridium taeniosporum]
MKKNKPLIFTKKKNKLLLFTKILYSICIIWTIISFIIIYSNINNNISSKLVIGYGLFIFFMLLYIPIITLFNARKLKWNSLKRILKKFISLFITFFIVNCAFDYIFRSYNIDVFNSFYHALGLSFGLAFMDVIFFKKENN